MIILNTVKTALECYSESYLVHGNLHITLDEIYCLHKYLTSEYNDILKEKHHNVYSCVIMNDLDRSIKYIDRAIEKLTKKK